jgi:hypothetical protein
MTETEATIEVLNKVCLYKCRCGPPAWHAGRSWVKLHNDKFTLPPLRDRWREYTGFELLEELARRHPDFAAKLAEPIT